MAKAEASVEELVRKIEQGELRLPEMQRRYVWRSTRVRDLLDSLYRGYPSGAILVWQTDENVPLQEFAVQQKETAFRSTQLLLDGQQRLTSLAAVIRGEPVNVRGLKKPIELLFNLEHPDNLSVVTEVHENAKDEEEDLIEDEADSTEDELQRRINQMTFVVATKKLAGLPHWVKVTDVFKSEGDADFLTRAGVSDFQDPNYERYSARLARLRGIRNYMYRMDVLEPSLSYDEVTEIFVRVNSLGAKLRGSDLALAQITAKWRGALKEFQAFQNTCARNGFKFDLGLYIKNLVVFATGQSRFKSVAGLDPDTLKTGWKEGCKGMEFALNFLKNNAKIDSPALLSSPFLLITLAFYGYKRSYTLSPQEDHEMRYWALVANAKGRYSRGSSETILDQDVATLRDGGARELTERLRQQVGRLDVAQEELEGRNQRSALFKTMFLAFRAAGAKDWKSQLAIALSNSGVQHRLQFHHLFAKAKLKNSSYTRQEIDDISNLCFISGKLNREISDKTPNEYFPRIMKTPGPDAFESQCIPTDERLWEPKNYKAFLEKRRSMIAERINQFLEHGRDDQIITG